MYLIYLEVWPPFRRFRFADYGREDSPSLGGEGAIDHVVPNGNCYCV